MKVVKNFGYNILLQLTAIVVPIILIPYLSRKIGPSGIGINAYINSFAQYFVIFASLGLNILGTREAAYVEDDKKKLTEVFSKIQSIKGVMVITSLILYFIVVSIQGKYLDLFLVSSCIISSTFFDISWLFIGLQDFKKVTIRSVITKVATAIVVISFVKSSSDVPVYIFIMSISQLVGNLIYWVNLKKYINIKSIRFNFSKKILISSTVLLLPQLSVTLPGILLRTFLNSQSDLSSVGYYDNSDKIISILLTITTSLSTVLMPRISADFSKKNKDSIAKIMNYSLKFVVMLSIGIIFGFFAISNSFSTLFFGKDFQGINLIINGLLVNVLFVGLIQVIGRQYLISVGRSREFNISILVNIALIAVLAVPSINLFGTIGSAYALIFSNIVSLGILLNYTKKDGLYAGCGVELIKNVLSGIVMLVVLSFFSGGSEIGWFSLMLKCLVGFVVFLLSSRVLKTELVIVIEKKIRSR